MRSRKFFTPVVFEFSNFRILNLKTLVVILVLSLLVFLFLLLSLLLNIALS